MGIVKFYRHAWTPTPGKALDRIFQREELDIAISLARVIAVNGISSVAGNPHGSYDSLRLEAELLATALDNTQMNGKFPLRRTKAFDCSSLHIKSFIITAAGLGLLTASLESLIVKNKFNPLQIKQFDLIPATTPRKSSGRNSRPDLLINLPGDRQLVGEAKGRRDHSGHFTQEKRTYLTKLHEWASNNEFKGCPLALSWASILEDRTILSLYHTDLTKEVEPIHEEPRYQYPNYEPLPPTTEAYPTAPPRMAPEELEWERLVSSLIEPTLEESDADSLWWTAPNPNPDDYFLAGLPIRGEWTALSATRRSLFVGVFRETPEGSTLERIRRAYISRLERNTVAPLDIAMEGRLFFAVAQNEDLATWSSLRRALD
ncbi:hypothetical protein [Herbidospora mongoliensis]|uniref:hypothetical protein n=1 Tax=Herbidospora mongoliensis TaxID=688067 RepID=UPI000B0B0E91|nr:hypothetical protein [Herbidospora mongoliensis]